MITMQVKVMKSITWVLGRILARRGPKAAIGVSQRHRFWARHTQPGQKGTRRCGSKAEKKLWRPNTGWAAELRDVFVACQSQVDVDVDVPRGGSKCVRQSWR
jgi:hypothetical protein